MSIEILKSTTISADKIQQAGFVFAFPKIELALQDLLDK
jgi:NAD dependent epimerase/dehydratase family enzyme